MNGEPIYIGSKDRENANDSQWIIEGYTNNGKYYMIAYDFNCKVLGEEVDGNDE